ncbi:YIP1 family protein [Alkalicoccobacillus porphyridii]|uniref:YIP1 family protein n=2 Tax=Alkalicoccobacillus porphyridii TaxID=2597270 RepID=A0A554A2G3_9BACI|nr:YIP1 family protein [Alkalicoccobacillus porphyridii]TSB47865.1 YIP1 family protein [Alkalicoccobacillus porphyridii]
MNNETMKYPFYLSVHPFDGFWELKYELNKRISVLVSFIILFLLIVTNVLSSQYSGFVVNLYNPNEMNSLMEIVYVVVPVLFWCVANWSLTTLLDGEGKFVDIFIATCFALVPLVIINFPWIWLSNFISLQEATFYYLSQSIAVVWFLFLMFVGNMTVHQFSPSKTLVTISLTIVAMGFMAFLCLLFFSLIQEVIAFISVIYQEIVFRY